MSEQRTVARLADTSLVLHCVGCGGEVSIVAKANPSNVTADKLGRCPLCNHDWFNAQDAHAVASLISATRTAIAAKDDRVELKIQFVD